MGNEFSFAIFVAGNALALAWFAVFAAVLLRRASAPPPVRQRRPRLAVTSLCIGALGMAVLGWRLVVPADQMGRTGALLALNVPEPDTELHVVGADGTDLRRLTHSPGFEWYPTWSPDGRSIACIAEEPLAGDRLVVVPATGGRPRTLATRVVAADPDWSPDGTAIIISRSISAEAADAASPTDEDFIADILGQSELFTIDVAAGSELRLTDTPESESDPAWSPDGSTIAYVREWERPDWGVVREIWLMDRDGRNRRQLTPGASWERGPRWSPDGTQVAFVRLDDAQAWRLFVVDAVGGEARPVAPELSIADLDWGPDGRFVFTTFEEGPDTDLTEIRSPPMRLCTMGPDGSDVTELLDLPGLNMGVAWSPDGRSIAFAGPPNAAPGNAAAAAATTSEDQTLAIAALAAYGFLGPLALWIAAKSRREEEPSWVVTAGWGAGLALTAVFVFSLLAFPFGTGLMGLP